MKAKARGKDAIQSPAIFESGPVAGVGIEDVAGNPSVSVVQWKIAGICLSLAAIVWLVFGQTLNFDFINYDDNTYVYENHHITGGIGARAFLWAFTHIHSDNWHPVTTLSHMLDCQIYGLHPWGPHLGNVLLHGAASVLLFLALRGMTGALWRSAFVAAVFAIHPLRVESVAWISERKDVLSGVFFMLTLLAYERYVRHGRRKTGYLAVMVFFGLGLMSKPTLVTLPFVLLLLDGWPLGRLETGTPWREVWSKAKPLILEKVPLLLMSGASCAVTLCVQKNALTEDLNLSFPYRIANAVVSYIVYLAQMFWPVDLAVLYPHPADRLPLMEVALALLLLAAVSTAAGMLWKKQPWLAVGWLWYLGMLVPMIGLAQVGGQAHADRYTYLPQIGIYLMVTWTVARLCARLPYGRVINSIAAVAVLLPLILCARVQTSYWHDSESLWRHALASTEENHIAHDHLGDALEKKGELDAAIAQYYMALQIDPRYADVFDNLGLALEKKGRIDEAIALFQRALEIDPHMVEVYNNLAIALQQKGAPADAIVQYQKALAIDPDRAEVLNNLGLALRQEGKLDEAIAQYEKALQNTPDFAEAQNNLGIVLQQEGEMDEAIAHYQKALEINPVYPDAINNLGIALQRKGRWDEAIAEYQKALEIDPANVQARNNLAYVFATCGNAQFRDGWRAMKFAQEADQLTGGGNPAILGTLAAAYAEAGQFPDAVETVQRAIHLAESQGASALVGTLQGHLKLYQAGQPLRDHQQVVPARKAAP